MAAAAIDRTTTTPFLLRCFWNINRSCAEFEYKNVSQDVFPKNEIQIYTWADATLKEICDLLRDVMPNARDRRTSLILHLVYPDKRGHHIMKQIANIHSTRVGPDDGKTLASIGFQTGDFLDIAVMLPRHVGST